LAASGDQNMAIDSRLAVELEVGHLLRTGRNVVALRVHQFSPASYVEDQNMWWLSGVFRSVTLLARPAGGIDDVFDQLPARSRGRPWASLGASIGLVGLRLHVLRLRRETPDANPVCQAVSLTGGV